MFLLYVRLSVVSHSTYLREVACPLSRDALGFVPKLIEWGPLRVQQGLFLRLSKIVSVTGS
jgi:hypothetical protein